MVAVAVAAALIAVPVAVLVVAVYDCGASVVSPVDAAQQVEATAAVALVVAAAHTNSIVGGDLNTSARRHCQ